MNLNRIIAQWKFLQQSPVLSDTSHSRLLRRKSVRAIALVLLSSNLTVAALAQERVGSPAVKDGPTNITFSQLFKEGKTAFSDVDPAKVAPMPHGYASYKNEGFKVETEAVVVGPHVVDQATSSYLHLG